MNPHKNLKDPGSAHRTSRVINILSYTSYTHKTTPPLPHNLFLSKTFLPNFVIFRPCTAGCSKPPCIASRLPPIDYDSICGNMRVKVFFHASLGRFQPVHSLTVIMKQGGFVFTTCFSIELQPNLFITREQQSAFKTFETINRVGII